MQLVKSAQYAPGCCITGMYHEDLVDFQRDIASLPDGAHLYVAQQHVADAARLMGWESPEEVAKLRRRAEANEETTDRVKELEDQLAELKRAIALTHVYGAVVNRKGEVKLREMKPQGVR